MNRLTLALLLTLTTALSAPAHAKNDRGCPPGLAKKEVPCVPPGLAKKAVDSDELPARWRVGYPVSGDYVLIPRSEWNRLALRDFGDGSSYLVVDNEILRVTRDTLVVLEAIRILDRALN